ncbi:hypothetical protein, partial [Pseudomonas sp. RW3S2]|uniref:hypothetical protein n=1 Tax=Pseudomonas sp. RW3S2 TaxID=485884 RepID=UPI001EE2BB9C
ELFVSTEARILRFPHCLSSVYFEVFPNRFLSKAFNVNDLPTAPAAFIAARRRIIRGLKSQSTL